MTKKISNDNLLKKINLKASNRSNINRNNRNSVNPRNILQKHSMKNPDQQQKIDINFKKKS